MGHSDAKFDEAMRAAEAGARGLTHLWNAMRVLHHREPGIVGLLNDVKRRRLYYGTIVDGVHLHDGVVRLAYACHPDGMVLVTDCMAAAGLGDGLYCLGDQPVEVLIGVAYLKGRDTVAGSLATMNGCVRRLSTLLYENWLSNGVDDSLAKHRALEAALRCATINPASFLGIEKDYGALSAGCKADFLLLDDDINIHAAFVGGRLCYPFEERS